MEENASVKEIYVAAVSDLRSISDFGPREWSFIIFWMETTRSRPDTPMPQAAEVPVDPGQPQTPMEDQEPMVIGNPDDPIQPGEMPLPPAPPAPPAPPVINQEPPEPDIPMPAQPPARERSRSRDRIPIQPGPDVPMPVQPTAGTKREVPEDEPSVPKGKKKKKPRKKPPGEPADNVDDPDTPGATGSGQQNPVNIPVPHTPVLPLHTGGTPSEASDITPTEYYDPNDFPFTEDDLFVDTVDEVWKNLDENTRCVSMTCSFSFPCNVDSPIDVAAIAEPFFMHRASGVTEESYKAKPKLTAKARLRRARKEANATDKRKYAKQMVVAKTDECKSWVDNDVYDLVDLRTHHPKNYVTGRWVLTVKYDKEAKFLKCKARWVLRGFQDRQKDEQQTDSPTTTRPGFRLTCQHAANNLWSINHMDLKTAFLQGEHYDVARDVVAALPPEAGYPPYMAARLKKPAYGMNDAPRRWWNRVDAVLYGLGLIPTRADRCCYVKYEGKPKSILKATAVHFAPREWCSDDKQSAISLYDNMDTVDKALDYLLNPVAGSAAKGKSVMGLICLHVDDLFFAGNKLFHSDLVPKIREAFQVGSEDTNDVEFVGQRVRWVSNVLEVDQHKIIDTLAEVTFDKSLKDEEKCNPDLHTEFRSVLGQINWLQSRTQFHIAYAFSRCASASAGPTIADVKALNKVVRRIRAEPVTLRFFPLKGKHRILGYPDASYRNNADKSSQRGQVIFIAEDRVSGVVEAHGSLVDFESHKIKRTTLSTTVAELYAFMKCFGTCQFLRGLWMDVSGESCDLHMRTDANNLVTTATTTHLPEQRETAHMIQMLRKESCSGAIEDLAHIRTQYCLADCLTKSSAKSDELTKAVQTGVLPQVDVHPSFRSLLKNRAYVASWLARNVSHSRTIQNFFGEDVTTDMKALFSTRTELDAQK